MTHPIILDTDLGSDVDDALALAVLLGYEGVDLRAVTTVYGDTLLRARLAQRYARLAGRRIAVHAGESATRSGKPVWWAGHEGSLHDDLGSEPVEPEGAVELLVRAAAARAGELVLMAIGPLTDVAAALDADPAFAGNLRQLVIMGGRFPTGSEHNLTSDAAAAARVFGTDVPALVCGLEITQRLRVEPDMVSRIAAAGPLGAALAADIDQWAADRGGGWSVPHDPTAIQAWLRPELFTLSDPGRITVDPATGVSTFTAEPDGPHRIVVDLDEPAVATAIVDDILAACAG